MEEATKSDIGRTIAEALDKRENFEGEFLIKKTQDTVKISLEFKERESFTDKNGVKWVRA